MRPASQPAPRIEPSLGWDVLQVALAGSVLLQIWRVQDLIPMLGVWGLPIAVSLLSLLLFVLDRDPRRRFNLRRHPLLQISCGILVLVILSIPGSLYPRASFEFLLKDFSRSIVLMMLMAGTIRGLADVERFVWLQLAGAALYCGVVLLHFDVGINGRLGEIVMYDSNDLALLIVCTLPLSVYLLWRSRTLFGRLFVLGTAGVLLLVLVKTGSRGGFLGLLAAVGSMVLGLRAVALRKRLGAVAVVLVLLVGFSSDRYWEMMQTMLHPSTDYNWSGNSDVGRMELWKRGLGYMTEHPFFGVGATAFSTAEGTLAPQAARQDLGIGFKWSTAHNSLIQIGAELGVLGLVLFVALLVSGLRTLFRIGRGPPAGAAFLAQTLTASLVAYVVSGFFLSAAYWAYLYALLGMAAGLAKVASPAAVPNIQFGVPNWRSVARPSVPSRRLGRSAP